MVAKWLGGVCAVSVACFLAAVPATANAQDSSDDREETSSVGTSDLQAIIVTARRRDERLQDVPIAVSAVTGEQAESIGLDDTQALVIATPSLDFGKVSSYGAIPFLRGVGTSFGAAGVESPVAIYVDDVYISSPNGNLMSLNNIQSVQVLKGPQGTLFGRNATGGVIQITTKAPSFVPEGKVYAGYGNYDTFEGGAYLSAPLGENVAFSLSASGSKQNDGYGESLTTGKETQKSWDWNARGKLLFAPGESTEITLSGDYSKQRSDIGANLATAPGSFGFGGYDFAGEYNTYAAGDDYTKIKQWGVSLKIDQELAFADLVSISAYRKTDMYTLLDQDGGPVPAFDLELWSPVKTFSQELRLVSNSDGPFQWVLGGFYFHSNSQYKPALLRGLIFDQAFSDPTAFLRFDDTQKLNSYSGFAEGTYEVVEDTNITLGLRYTSDSFTLKNEGFNFGNAAFCCFTDPTTIYTVKDKFNKLTYRAILDHKFTEDVLGYVSYSRGFKSGGYNLPEPGSIDVVAAVRPEVLDAFEVGLKSVLLDGALTFNLAGFYYDYKDMAVSVTTSTAVVQRNAAKSKIKGFEFDVVAVPADGLRIAAGLGYLDSEYKSFPDGPTYIPNAGFPFGNTVIPSDLSGNRLQRAPKLTFNIAPSYTMRAGSGDLTFAVNWYHNAGYFSDAENRLRQPTYDLVNGSISYALDNGFGARLWAKNLTDERYYAFIQADPFKDAVAFADPRTYGVTVWKEF